MPENRYRQAWLVLALALGCRPEPSPTATREPSPSREPPPLVDHGSARPYWGVWTGPELQLSFAGPWVLIAPREGGPGAQPIELRATVERQQGDAFALRTSVAGRYAADFVRPSDWTLLVEAGELALAMGDEPLAAYLAIDQPLLIGPALLDAVAIPDAIAGEDVLACLERASEICRALEAEGPRAVGCREAQWAVCVAHLERGHADPTVRAANAAARTIHESHAAIRYCEGLQAAAPAELQAEARALHGRALARAAEQLARLRDDGPLPDDPHLPTLLAALREAGLMDP
ncbi:MAG TPA: hypothetical protein VK034_02650, partial [Enhygromyxa sp.]|nr:hypothetical protein [Enhygromyxa sp.]